MKPVKLSKEDQDYLKNNSSKYTIPDIAKKFNLTYNSAIHYINFRGLPYRGTKGNIKIKQKNIFDKNPITGF